MWRWVKSVGNYWWRFFDYNNESSENESDETWLAKKCYGKQKQNPEDRR